MTELARTKIVATVGPATASRERIAEICRGGVNVIRVNFAHGSHEDHRQTIKWVREVAGELNRPIAVLADLAGPKIRIGALPAPVELEVGTEVVLAPEEQAGERELPTTYADLATDVGVGARILLDDGKLELRVRATAPPRVYATVERGGLLVANKGINLPGVAVSAPALTPKDREDLQVALDAGVDYVGLSFVQRPEDVEELRGLIPSDFLIVAKIEKDVAVERIGEILERADAVMVARGDLGVELPFEQVPVAQKRIIQYANLYARPVITATQMLESMIEHSRPTRAEASDVANALFDGTDAVMLSGETAVGKHPALAVDAMVRIAREIERTSAFVQGPHYDVPILDHLRAGATRTEHAIAAATVEAVSLLGAPAIITFTRTGSTTRLVSSYRPAVPILGVTYDLRTYRQLALVWGVVPVLCRFAGDPTYADMLDCARNSLLAIGAGAAGDRVVVTAGVPFHVRGTTNMLRVEVL
ncbi:MAG TPA: pyruvate kinase [Longimicrobiales bacterium]|nr:pyruvate kinase [Longimicrobiales bacterium]